MIISLHYIEEPLLMLKEDWKSTKSPQITRHCNLSLYIYFILEQSKYMPQQIGIYFITNISTVKLVRLERVFKIWVNTNFCPSNFQLILIWLWIFEIGSFGLWTFGPFLSKFNHFKIDNFFYQNFKIDNLVFKHSVDFNLDPWTLINAWKIKGRQL